MRLGQGLFCRVNRFCYTFKNIFMIAFEHKFQEVFTCNYIKSVSPYLGS